MNYDIIKILDLEDNSITVRLLDVTSDTKIFEVEKILVPHYCPSCDTVMHSLGVRPRKVNHPVLQDGFKVQLLIRQRRWRCQNPDCRLILTDTFSFVEKRKRNTLLTDLMIVDAFRSIFSTASEIAERFNVSDTYAIETFSRYVDMKRLPLSEVICIDEVKLNISRDCKYALMILDFLTGDVIDLLPERRKRFTEPYFAAIPHKERKRVKYIISDMYTPYINYAGKYFPDAVSVVDSFHVVGWINNALLNYLRALIRKFKARDEEKERRLSEEKGREIHLPVSDEVYLLQNYKWVLLRNYSDIDHSRPGHIDRHFKYLMDTYMYEDAFFGVDDNLRPLHELKEKYITFNNRYAGKPELAGDALDELIDLYSRCDQKIFRRFSKLLKKYKPYIINSFIMMQTERYDGRYFSRLSNGPMEAHNRQPGDIVRGTRGFPNPEHARNRILFAMRNDAPILGIPKDSKDVCTHTGKRRGPYTKKNNK